MFINLDGNIYIYIYLNELLLNIKYLNELIVANDIEKIQDIYIIQTIVLIYQ